MTQLLLRQQISLYDWQSKYLWEVGNNVGYYRGPCTLSATSFVGTFNLTWNDVCNINNVRDPNHFIKQFNIYEKCMLETVSVYSMVTISKHDINRNPRSFPSISSHICLWDFYETTTLFPLFLVNNYRQQPVLLEWEIVL